MSAPDIVNQIKAVHPSEMDADNLAELCASVLADLEGVVVVKDIERLAVVVGVLYHQAKQAGHSDLELPEVSHFDFIESPYVSSKSLQ